MSFNHLERMTADPRAIKSVERNRSVTKKYSIQDITRLARNIKVMREKGGTWTVSGGKIVLKEEGVTKTVQGREAFLIIAKNKRDKPQWHVHPFATGWYPSPEDMIIMSKHPHILVTRYGIWVISTRFEAPLKYPYIETENIGAYIESRHLYYRELYMRDTFDEHFNLALDAIRSYTSFMHSYGFNITFFPYTNKKYEKMAEAFAMRCQCTPVSLVV